MIRTPSIYSDEFWQEAKMSEMVERVAKAIIENELGAPPDNVLCGQCTKECKVRYRLMARAAIEAMREPTAAMYAATKTVGKESCMVEHYWKTMIDEALK